MFGVSSDPAENSADDRLIADRMSNKVRALEKEVTSLRQVLHRIARPDYVLKDDSGWIHAILRERMSWAKAALGPSRDSDFEG